MGNSKSRDPREEYIDYFVSQDHEKAREAVKTTDCDFTIIHNPAGVHIPEDRFWRYSHKTPLIIACLNGWRDIVSSIVLSGKQCRINHECCQYLQKNSYICLYKTAFMLVCEKKWYDIALEMVRNKYFDVGHQSAQIPKTPLMIAIENELHDVALEIMDRGNYKPDAREPGYHKLYNRRTALMYACIYYNSDVALRLIRECKSNLFVCDRTNNSSLSYACKNGMIDVVIELLKERPDFGLLNVINDEGKNCYYYINTVFSSSDRVKIKKIINNIKAMLNGIMDYDVDADVADEPEDDIKSESKPEETKTNDD